MQTEPQDFDSSEKVVKLKTKQQPPAHLNREQKRQWLKAERAKEKALAKMSPEERAKAEAYQAKRQAEHEKAQVDQKRNEERHAFAKSLPVTPEAMRELADKEFAERFPELLKMTHEQIRLNAASGELDFGLGLEFPRYIKAITEFLQSEGFHVHTVTEKGFRVDLTFAPVAAHATAIAVDVLAEENIEDGAA